MQRSWCQSPQWLASQDCHSLCRVLASLSVHAASKQLPQLFADKVAAFLRPTREFIACLESQRPKDTSLFTNTCVNFFDAETFALVKAVNISDHEPAIDPCIVCTSTSPVGTRLFFFCACGRELLSTSIDINDCEALAWRNVNMIDAPEEFIIEVIESIAFAPDGLQMAIGCQILFIGPEERYQETLLFVDAASLSTTHRMPMACDPTHLSYSQTGGYLAVVGNSSGRYLLALVSTTSMSLEQISEITLDALVKGVFFTCVGQLAVCFECREFGDSLQHSCILLDVPELSVTKAGGPHYPSMWACDRNGERLAVVNWSSRNGNGRSPRQFMLLECGSLRTIALSTELPYPDSLEFTFSGEQLVLCHEVQVLKLRRNKLETQRMSMFSLIHAGSLTVIRSVQVEFSLHRGLSCRGMTLVPEGGYPCVTQGQFLMEHIMHNEPPTQRDEEVLPMQADHDWADCVEANLLRLPPTSGVVDQNATVSLPLQSSDEELELWDQPPANVHILHYGSPPTSGNNAIGVFKERLLTGPELRPCREALEKVHGDNACTLPSGALIFIHPDCYTDVQSRLVGQNVSSAGLHIVIEKGFEYLVEEILSAMPFQRRPKLKPGARGRSEVSVNKFKADESSLLRGQSSTADLRCAVPSNLKEPVILVSRTFLQAALPLRSKHSVTQSTTDAVEPQNEAYYRSAAGKPPLVNHRRKIPCMDETS